MKAFLVGAGGSRGSVEGKLVPVASEFGQVVAEICSNWRAEYPSLGAVAEHLGFVGNEWPLEPVWSCLDWYAKLQPALPLPKPWRRESPDIKKALLAVYGRRCDEAAASVSADSTLAKLIRSEIQPADTVVSFNYDTIFERVAARQGRKLVCRPRGDDGIMFAKPHGSASWTLDVRTLALTWLSSDGSPLLESLALEDVDRGREPLLLGAVPIKSELIREVQEAGGVPTVFDVVAAQWRVVVEAIRDCDTLVVLGYSFPAEDQYGRFLFQEGLRLRARGLRVEFFELETRAGEREREILDTFRGRVEQIKYRGPILSRAA